MERPETGHSIAERTSELRWFSTYDLDNLRGMVLQQKWIITKTANGIIVSQDEEWRKIEVVDGGLSV